MNLLHVDSSILGDNSASRLLSRELVSRLTAENSGATVKYLDLAADSLPHLSGGSLAQALDLQEKDRPDLQILVMSATLEAARLEEYLKPCRVVESQGRMHPVEIRYSATSGYVDKRPIWEQAAEAFSGFVQAGGEGDVLIFMPGGFEIAQTIEAIRHCDESRGFILLPLHGELPPTDQDAAVARYEKRKVVVATNVAETSLTIDGIRCVIDSGLARIPRYDPYRGINTLLIEKISQAAAQLQRQNLFHTTFFALIQRFPNTHDRPQARFMGGAHFAIHDFIRLAEHRTSFTVTNHDVTDEKIAQHRATDFAGESAASLPMHVLRPNFDILRFSQRLVHLCDRGEGRCNHDFDDGDVVDFQ